MLPLLVVPLLCDSGTADAGGAAAGSLFPGSCCCWKHGATHRAHLRVAGVCLVPACLSAAMHGLCSMFPSPSWRPSELACSLPTPPPCRRASTAPRSSRWPCCCPRCLCSTRWAASMKPRWTGARRSFDTGAGSGGRLAGSKGAVALLALGGMGALPTAMSGGMSCATCGALPNHACNA